MENKIIRQINIDLITDTPNPIINWFNDLWSRLHVLEANVSHTEGGEIIYYIIDDKRDKQWIFYHDNINDRFLCNYTLYWFYLKIEFKLNYNEIQDITKLLVEKSLNRNINIGTPKHTYKSRLHNVEKALRNSNNFITLFKRLVKW